METDLARISARMSAINDDELKLISGTQQGKAEKLNPSTTHERTFLEKAKRAGGQIAQGALDDGKASTLQAASRAYSRLTTGTITERLQLAKECLTQPLCLLQQEE